MTYSNDLKLKIIGTYKTKQYTNVEIMKIYNISKDTFYRIIKDYNENKGNSKTKRTSKINEKMRAYVVKYVTSKVNFNYTILINLIWKKYNTIISKSTIYNILRDNKIKKKKIYSKQILSTPVKRAKDIKVFTRRIKRTDIRNLISVDESGIDTHIVSNNGWSKSGIKVAIVKTNKRIRYTVVSGIGYNKIIHYKIIKGSCNGKIFLQFIKELLRKVSEGKKVALLLDNARIHHYGEFKDYIDTLDNTELIYNVPYSPESNPIEKVFNDIKKYLKSTPINNGNIIRKIEKSFTLVKKENIKQYFRKSYNFYG